MATHEEIEAARRAAGEASANDRFALREVGARAPGYLPPVPDERDPYLRPAFTQADQSVEELDGRRTVSAPGREPGPSEFSHGRGLRPPTSLRSPSLIDQHHAIMRTNPADPTATVDYEGGRTTYTHVDGEMIEGEYIPRVRES
jgi:hypothetical protein